MRVFFTGASSPHPAQDGAEPVHDLILQADNRYVLFVINAGEEGATGTGAKVYRSWYQIALPDGESGCVQAAVPTDYDTGSDGRPSSVRFDLLPGVMTPE